MGVAQVNQIWFHLMISLLFISISSVASVKSKDYCVYTAYIGTGSITKAGTHSKISLGLYDADGNGVEIDNLEKWGGIMGPGYNYFERGNLDIFSGRSGCLNGPICKMNLTSDGSGPYHGWYCNYVKVTVSGADKPCYQNLFKVEQWLATDVSPYKLTAIRNNCNNSKSTEQKPLNPVI